MGVNSVKDSGAIYKMEVGAVINNTLDADLDEQILEIDKPWIQLECIPNV